METSDAQPTTPAPDGTRQGVYRIVHLSDLHFGGAFDCDLWDYIKTSVRNLQPRLIIVSGDLVETPSPLLLLQARRELRALAKASSSALFVIPGNHDVGLKGNVPIPYLSKLFWRVFANETIQAEASLGQTPWLVDRTQRPRRRWFRRSRRLLRWMGGQLWSAWKIRKLARGNPSPAEKQMPFCDGTVFVVPFDSNAKLRLATGYVNRGDIYAASSDLEQRQSTRDPSYAYALRIAVVHHHPVPIPHAIVREGLLSFEPFLVFRNAGEFLETLCQRSFDLVLHGHHHYYSFTRLALGGTNEGSEVGILSAGSATTRYAQAGRNSFNLLTISPNGRVEITPHFIGGGMVEGSKPPTGFALHTIDGLKLRNYKRAVELHELLRDEVSLELEVDEFGTQRMAYGVSRLRVTGGYSTDHRTFEFEVMHGRPVKSSVALDASSLQQGFSLVTIDPEKPNEIRKQIVFGRSLSSRTQFAADYTFSWRIQNTIMLTQWECEQLGREPTQSLQCQISFPARKLKLKLQLPEDLQDVKPYVECLIPSKYPSLDLDNEREAQAAGHIVDQEMSEFESTHLHSEAEGLWTLQVDHPLVGYSYSINWNVAARPDQGSSPITAGQVRMYRDLLLRFGEARRKGGPSNPVTAILKIYFDDLCRRYGTLDPHEEMTLTLMAYDAKDKKLRLVDGIWTGSAFDWSFALPLGDGVGGAAFKQRRPLLFVLGAMGSTGRDAYLGPDEGGDKFPYEALLSVPVFHPRERDAATERRGVLPDDTVGVISFGSTSPGSGLLNLLGETDDHSSQLRKFWGVSQLIFEAVLSEVLRPAVQVPAAGEEVLHPHQSSGTLDKEG